eukprot:m.53443 g.53443  ORF g.53443 m.53443 type:complete len:375 (+) comp6483_c0_seq1:212-1336(+)
MLATYPTRLLRGARVLTGAVRGRTDTAFAARKKAFLNDKKRSFVDFRNVLIRAGDGGIGCVSWHWEPHTRFAEADGAHGGRGGDVLFIGDEKLTSLDSILTTYIGKKGGHGQGKGMMGANSDSTYIPLPLGTLIMRDREILHDLLGHGETWLAARGGKGGKGNVNGRDRTREPHDALATPEPGEEFRYQLELKTLADVGLVGLPNAGKSSLLAAISRAHPKIAAYPFTTLNPHLGVVDFPDFWRMTVADIPGILPRAHTNVGLGLAFLRHIERSKVLLFILDMSGTNGSMPPREALLALRHELQCYSPELVTRPAIVAANKMDLASSTDNLAQLEACAGLPVVPICALTGDGVSTLTWKIRSLIEYLRATPARP